MLPGMGSHESTRRLTDEWLTPPHVLDALGRFDLDPCAPVRRPWPTAAVHYTVEDDGLELPWQGRVWLNPPYSTAGPWLDRMAAHGDGVALMFARTETDLWQHRIWPHATAFLFLAGRLAFHRDGEAAANSAGAPSVLVAYGAGNALTLCTCGLEGALVHAVEMVSRR